MAEQSVPWRSSSGKHDKGPSRGFRLYGFWALGFGRAHDSTKVALFTMVFGEKSSKYDFLEPSD